MTWVGLVDKTCKYTFLIGNKRSCVPNIFFTIQCQYVNFCCVDCLYIDCHSADCPCYAYGTASFKKVNNCWNICVSFYLERFDGQNLNVSFFNTRVN
jgi:hypothetical protein